MLCGGDSLKVALGTVNPSLRYIHILDAELQGLKRLIVVVVRVGID